MSGTSMDPGEKSAAQIEGEVEQTRANVSGTLDALRAKLAPSQMMDQVVEQISDYARGSGGTEFMRNLGTSVRENPLPVALIGAGIAWLLLSKGGSAGGTASVGTSTGHRLQPTPQIGSTRPGLADTAAEMAGSARVRISGAMDATQERVGQAAGAVSGAASQAAAAVGDVASQVAQAGSDLAGRASEAAGSLVQSVAALGHDARDAAQGGAVAVRDRVSSAAQGTGMLDGLAQAQPLLFGALGLALGAALGAALPRTRAEDELMGEARDELAERVGAAARDGYEGVRSAAGEQLQRAKEAVANTYAEAKDKLDQGGLSSLGDTLGKAAGDVSRAAGEALQGVAEGAKRGIAEAGQPPERPAGR
ncbi:DUF3618 domain-containing protein [Roseomonas sp. BN140053]|uniref:DUF3618 domain-containing protein n=1 Tax=Roseomonas sp. BN140053 TaxID=3391898 RepID=UPI0039E86674